jgi:RNA polymerase sigma factor (sigma-70 family)
MAVANGSHLESAPLGDGAPFPRPDETLAFFMAHRPNLVSYASGIVGSRAHAEDVVQEAWLRFDDASRLRLLEEPLGYLYRIVRNLALDGRRRLARETRGQETYAALAGEASASDCATPESEALHKDQLRIVMAAIAELPERTQIALEMHRVGGCKLREIAAHLGISVTLAHSLVADGIEHCRRRLRRS